MHRWICCLAFIAAASACGAARADARGEAVLKQLDDAMTRADDQYFRYDLITQEPGQPLRKQVMDVFIKGTVHRRVDFIAPGDVKGMKVLVLSRDKMYVYLPSYRKVRRVAGHAKEQGFMGTTFSHDDITTVTYSDAYAPRLLQETPTHYMVEAVRRQGASTPYSRLELDIRKDMQQASEIRYFNEAGQKIKTEVRRDYSCKGAVCAPRELKLTDHVRNDAWSKMVWSRWEVNRGVDDSFFSLRSLQRDR